MEYKDREVKPRVLAVQARMRTFDYFYGLRPGILLLRHSDNLNASLQTKVLCAAEAQAIANHTVARLKNSILGRSETERNNVRCRCTEIA